MSENDGKNASAWRQLGLLSAIPFILAIAPIVGYLLGQYLDTRFHSKPWLSMVLLILGFVAGVRESIRIVKLSQRED